MSNRDVDNFGDITQYCECKFSECWSNDDGTITTSM